MTHQTFTQALRQWRERQPAPRELQSAFRWEARFTSSLELSDPAPRSTEERFQTEGEALLWLCETFTIPLEGWQRDSDGELMSEGEWGVATITLA